MIKQNKNSPKQLTPDTQRSGSHLLNHLQSKYASDKRLSSASLAKERSNTPSKRQVADDF